MEMKFCQSCGMPLTNEILGTNSDGSPNEDYCIYCYKDGKFTQDMTMEQMIDHCARFTDEINKSSGQNLTVEQMKEQMRQFFPHLKRWQQCGTSDLIKKAEQLLAECSTVTIASVNSDGFTRPVPMAKGDTNGCGTVWMATGADSVKVADFRRNPKAGLWVEADGIILGSPVYSADVSAKMKAFLERAVVVVATNPGLLRHKVGASVAAVRRAGGMTTVDTMNHFMLNKEMIVVGSTYIWFMERALEMC